MEGVEIKLLIALYINEAGSLDNQFCFIVQSLYILSVWPTEDQMICWVFLITFMGNEEKAYAEILPAKGVLKENNKDIFGGDTMKWLKVQTLKPDRLDLNPGCMTSDESTHNLWVPRFPHLWNGDDDSSSG